jgi:hypothetical protein
MYEIESIFFNHTVLKIAKAMKIFELRLDVLAAEKRSFGEGEKNDFYLKRYVGLQVASVT